jgi:hypothetical protein
MFSKIKEIFSIWGAQWLNLARRLTLMKGVLLDLPNFQLSSMLSLMGIKMALAQEIRKCIWEGGKTNQKIFHLLNCKSVRTPKAHRGLGIKDPVMENIVLGSKLLWRMILRKFDWWKKDLIFK